MKISDIKIWVTRVPLEDVAPRTWVFVQVDTDEGISGVGEATCGAGGSIVVGHMLRHLRDSKVKEEFRESLLGENPEDIDRIWNKLFRRFLGGGGWGGFVSTVVSGIDIALWDIKGKVLQRPIYNLLGGRFRDRIPLYTHVSAGDPQRAADDALARVDEGYTALKIDPFSPEMGRHHRNYTTGTISAQGAANGERNIAAIRDAVGPDFDLMVDVHGNFNVPTAIKLARRLEDYDLTWFEEPVQPESHDALRQVREAVSVPICVGERIYTRWGFVPILKDRLADYIMPDVLYTGGISELRKIANMAEAFHIPVAPHGPHGPINILASAHPMMTVPNFFLLETARGRQKAGNECINPGLDIRDGNLYLSDRPGLGIELNLDFIKAHPDPDWS